MKVQLTDKQRAVIRICVTLLLNALGNLLQGFGPTVLLEPIVATFSDPGQLLKLIVCTVDVTAGLDQWDGESCVAESLGGALMLAFLLRLMGMYMDQMEERRVGTFSASERDVAALAERWFPEELPVWIFDEALGFGGCHWTDAALWDVSSLNTLWFWPFEFREDQHPVVHPFLAEFERVKRS